VILCLSISPGSAESLCRCGGKVNYLLMPIHRITFVPKIMKIGLFMLKFFGDIVYFTKTVNETKSS